MKTVSVIAVILTVVGAINWGLVGLGMWTGTNLNLVNLLFGAWYTLEVIVYLLVGVSGLLIGWAHLKKKCVCK